MSLLKSLFAQFPMRGKIALYKKGSGGHFLDIDQIDYIEEHYNQEHSDWYFHIATHDSERAKTRGSIDSSQQFTCLWADIDLATKDDKKYPTHKEVETFFTHLDTMGIMPSALVDSGRGIHAYWFLDKPYETQEYLAIGKAWALFLKEELNKIVTDRDVVVDPVGDFARILRLPGTRHSIAGKVVHATYLDNNKRYLLQPLAEMTDFFSRRQVGKGKVAVKNQLLANMGAITSDKPSYVSNMYHVCNQVKNYYDQAGQVEEPTWYTIGGLFQYAEDGVEEFLKMSDMADQFMDSDRSEGGALKKLDQWKNATSGPATCSALNDVNGGICAECPKWGKITTPLQVGYTAPVIFTPEPQQMNGELQMDPNEPITSFIPPYPYLFDENDHLCVEVSKGNGSSKKEIKTICYNRVVPEQRIWDEDEEHEVLYFKIETKHDGWRTCCVPLSSLQGSCPAQALITGAGALIIGDSGMMSLYLIKCAAYMQELKKVNQSYARIGWRGSDKNDTESDKDDRFVLGKATFYCKERNRMETLTDSLESVVKDISMKGDIDNWVQGTSILSRKGLEPHLLCFFGGFAAPLLRATDFSGMLINLVSRDSGTYKSFTLKMITSIYGVPKFDHLLSRDSPKSIMKKVACRSDLPISYDEITNIEQDNLSDLTYALTQGREQDRLNQDSSLKRNDANWRTMMFSTSNASLDDILGTEHMAERMRLLEMSVQHCSLAQPMDHAEAVTAIKMVSDNYGIAGAKWIDYLTSNKDEVFRNARVYVEELTNNMDSTGDKRFWTSFIALSIYAANLTKELGLHNFDLRPMAQYAKSLLEVSESKVTDDKVPLASYIGTFLNANMACVQNIQYNNLSRFGEVTLEPTSKLVVRMEVRSKLSGDNSVGFFSITAFKKMLVQNRVSYQEFIAVLKVNNLLINERVVKKVTVKNSASVTTMTSFSVDMKRYIEMYGEVNEIITAP